MIVKEPGIDELIKLAIGKNGSQNEFANRAGITAEYLNRLIKHPDKYTPSRITLQKIADASNGRVSLERLEKCCGFDPMKKPEEALEAVGEFYDAIESVKDYKHRIGEFCGKATRYDSFYDVLETVGMLCGKRPFHYQIDGERNYTGRGRAGAEKTANVQVSFSTDDYTCTFGFVLFFCKTEKGGIIFSDAAFDLVTMNEFDHPVGGKKLLEISTLPDQNRSAYQTVYTIEKHPKIV